MSFSRARACSLRPFAVGVATCIAVRSMSGMVRSLICGLSTRSGKLSSFYSPTECDMCGSMFCRVRGQQGVGFVTLLSFYLVTVVSMARTSAQSMRAITCCVSVQKSFAFACVCSSQSPLLQLTLPASGSLQQYNICCNMQGSSQATLPLQRSGLV